MANNKQLLTDIKLGLRQSELRPVYEVETERRRLPSRPGLRQDMATISGRENLGQAVFIRLLTPKGELTELGHPEYGSRLHELIGRQNTATNRNLVRLFILESLALEPRIEEIIEATVEPALGSRDRVNVLLRVKPVGEAAIVIIGPFTLELEQ